MKGFTAILFAAFFCASTALADYQKEYIILSGGPALIEWEKFKPVPHDRWWGNFVRTARIRIQELRAKHGYGAQITWLVYRRGYDRRGQRQDNRDLISLIHSVRDRYKVNLIWVSSGAEVLNYLNEGRPRNQCKIANFEYFGHSNRACFMLDYSNEIDSASKVWIHEDDLQYLRRGLFSRGAFVKSWGCHTGEGMSQKFRRATGVRMIGAVGKTDYSTGAIPKLSTPGGRWAS